eukprot:3153649-Rhodomonas_salina.1
MVLPSSSATLLLSAAPLSSGAAAAVVGGAERGRGSRAGLSEQCRGQVECSAFGTPRAPIVLNCEQPATPHAHS